MHKKIYLYPLVLLTVLSLFLPACKSKKQPPASDIATTPEQLQKKAKDNIREFLDFAASNQNNIGDSIFLIHLPLLQQIYEKKDFEVNFSLQEQWNRFGDSMLSLVSQAKLYGLYPQDYHFTHLDTINKRLISDTAGGMDRRDAILWAKADIMLTDAFFKMVTDVKLGRLPKDSITLRKDSSLTSEFYLQQWQTFEQSGSVARVLQSLEPVHKGYHELKAGIQKFLDSTANRTYTQVPAPGKDSLSRQAYKKALQTRLYESGFLTQDSSIAVDSATMADAVKKFQKQQGIFVDGKAGGNTLRLLNVTNEEKFARIALTLDKYKQLPDTMPARYLWVNLPSFYMQLLDNDTVKIVSRIVCGKPITRTPLLTSAISEMITYPQWTVPSSIIEKEILPGVKRDTTYFEKKGFSLIDKDGNEVDPHTVEWKKYKKGIPYKVVQGSGDDNALGILKFNFNNKYSVYLHDTNQRYLFGQAVRSLSHGCVRVQEWQELAYSLLKFDTPDEKRLQAREDSLKAWLGRKEKRSIGIRKRLPLYIRYFTCEGKNGDIIFYDDIYGEDKLLRERYFAGKS